MTYKEYEKKELEALKKIISFCKKENITTLERKWGWKKELCCTPISESSIWHYIYYKMNGKDYYMAIEEDENYEEIFPKLIKKIEQDKADGCIK